MKEINLRSCRLVDYTTETLRRFSPRWTSTGLQSCRFTPLVDANDRPVDHCPISLEPMEDPVLVCDGAPAAKMDWQRGLSMDFHGFSGGRD